MPFIHTITTKTVTPEMEAELTRRLGVAITKLPGKTEQWLMTGVQGDVSMAFRGKASDALVFSEVKILGHASRESYDALTEELTHVYCDVLGVEGEGVYIQYVEADVWGHDGYNF